MGSDFNARLRPKRPWHLLLGAIVVNLIGNGIQVGGTQNYKLARTIFVVSGLILMYWACYLPILRTATDRVKAFPYGLSVVGLIIVTCLECVYLAPQPDPNASPATISAIEKLFQKYFTPQRAYLVFDGPMRFPDKIDGNGKTLSDRNFQVGDRLEFNYFTNVIGPRPIQTHGTHRALALAPDAKIETQQELIRLFRQPPENPVIITPATLMPSNRRFGTVGAVVGPTADKKPLILDQQTIDEIHAGKKIVFVIVELGYMDLGQLHYARVCQYLQPPAYAPGIWHDCHVPGFDADDNTSSQMAGSASSIAPSVPSAPPIPPLTSVLKMFAHMNGTYRKPNQSTSNAELEIDNPQDEPFDKVDLWISRTHKLIRRISARPSGVSKCSYEPVDALGTSVRAIFKGADGSRIAIDSREATELGLQAPGSSKWHLYCERVDRPVPVVLDLDVDGDPLGEYLQVSGSYQVVLGTGSNLVKVNESILVTK